MNKHLIDAEELKRLRESHAELLEAIRRLISVTPGTNELPCIRRARAAIAAAEKVVP